MRLLVHSKEKSKEDNTMDNFQVEDRKDPPLLVTSRPKACPQAFSGYANLLRGWDTPEYL